MQKAILSLSLVLLAGLGLTACKKEYSCSCSFSYEVSGQTVTEQSSYVNEYSSKSRAKEACDDRAEDYMNTGASSASCVSVVK